ncbi:MAG: cytochrome c, partial [Gemmatimonadetes bacterium]|nr:cytochrome c [Gemmatimonadota bacterium]
MADRVILATVSAVPSLRLSAFVLTALYLCLPAPASAQLPYAVNGADLADASGEAIYANSCANCHGLDGTGFEPSLLAFEEEIP